MLRVQNEAKLEGAARGLTPAGLIAVAWCGFALAAFFVALRCYARISETRRLYSDDYWLLAALGFLLTNAVLQTLQTPYLYYLVYSAAGWVPAGEALFAKGTIYIRYEFFIIALFWTITWSVKASFLAMYWRLFAGLPSYRKLWWAVVVFAILAYIGCWIASAWSCHPPSTYFHFGRCAKAIDTEASIISISYSTSVDIMTDLMIMVLPIRMLRELQVNRKQKLGLAAIFSVGFIVIGAALLRLSQIVGQARTDPVGLAVWGLVESSISVVTGSLPALKALLTHAIERTIHRSAHLSSTSGKRRHPSMKGSTRPSFSKARARADAIPLSDYVSYENAPPSTTKSVEGQIIVEREYLVH